MNNAGQGQNAAGSWQPDPTGRYKLRWRNETGNWTEHVYSDDGKLGSDHYTPPPESAKEQEGSTAVTAPGPAPQRATIRLRRRHDLMLVAWIAAGVAWFCMLYGPWPWDTWLGTQNLGDWLTRAVTLVTILAVWATVRYFRTRRQLKSSG